MIFRKRVFNVLSVSINWHFSRNATPLFALQKLNGNSNHCKRKSSDSPSDFKKHEIPSALSKYELFSEEANHEVLDVEEERRLTSSKKIYDEFEGVRLQCGVTGVFDIEEIVSLLRKEKGDDIVVIKIPSEYRYADYMVIVTGRSTRHMLAMSDFVRRVYKKKVGVSGYVPRLEGKESNNWMATDLGNIILHVFNKSDREVFDLETLWTVGREFDTLTRRKNTSSLELTTDYKKILASLTPKT